MAEPSPKKERDRRTRRAVLDLLKQNGPADANTLAAELGLTGMAVRQHLYDLSDQKLVDFVEEPRPVGRPAKLWRLTPAADQFFPDGHAELAVSLIQILGQTAGPRGMDKLLAARAEQQAADYEKALPTRGSLKRRVQALAKQRSREGYMAEVVSQDDKSLLLIENHCPICSAAAACQGLCAMELDVFRRVLGGDVSIERTEHIQAGARRCAYRIAPSG